MLGVINLALSIAPGHQRLAWISGLVSAFHPTLIYAATHVQVASLGTALFIWTLAMAHRTGASKCVGHAVITGALLASLALTDPILALAVLGVAWAVCAPWVVPVHWRRSIALLALVGATAMAGVAPWLLRNVQVHGEFVAIKSTFGYAFWQGNCSKSEGTDKVVRRSVEQVLSRMRGTVDLAGLNRTLWEARHEAGYIDDIALSREDYRLLGRVSEPERSRILFRRAIEELAARPGRYAQLCLLRAAVLHRLRRNQSQVAGARLSAVSPWPDALWRTGHLARGKGVWQAAASDRNHGRGDRDLPFAYDRLGPLPHSR